MTPTHPNLAAIKAALRHHHEMACEVGEYLVASYLEEALDMVSRAVDTMNED